MSGKGQKERKKRKSDRKEQNVSNQSKKVIDRKEKKLSDESKKVIVRKEKKLSDKSKKVTDGKEKNVSDKSKVIDKKEKKLSEESKKVVDRKEKNVSDKIKKVVDRKEKNVSDKSKKVVHKEERNVSNKSKEVIDGKKKSVKYKSKKVSFGKEKNVRDKSKKVSFGKEKNVRDKSKNVSFGKEKNIMCERKIVSFGKERNIIYKSNKVILVKEKNVSDKSEKVLDLKEMNVSDKSEKVLDVKEMNVSDKSKRQRTTSASLFPKLGCDADIHKMFTLYTWDALKKRKKSSKVKAKNKRRCDSAEKENKSGLDTAEKEITSVPGSSEKPLKSCIRSESPDKKQDKSGLDAAEKEITSVPGSSKKPGKSVHWSADTQKRKRKSEGSDSSSKKQKRNSESSDSPDNKQLKSCIRSDSPDTKQDKSVHWSADTQDKIGLLSRKKLKSKSKSSDSSSKKQKRKSKSSLRPGYNIGVWSSDSPDKKQGKTVHRLAETQITSVPGSSKKPDKIGLHSRKKLIKSGKSSVSSSKKHIFFKKYAVGEDDFNTFDKADVFSIEEVDFSIMQSKVCDFHCVDEESKPSIGRGHYYEFDFSPTIDISSLYEDSRAERPSFTKGQRKAKKALANLIGDWTSLLEETEDEDDYNTMSLFSVPKVNRCKRKVNRCKRKVNRCKRKVNRSKRKVNRLKRKVNRRKRKENRRKRKEKSPKQMRHKKRKETREHIAIVCRTEVDESNMHEREEIEHDVVISDVAEFIKLSEKLQKYISSVPIPEDFDEGEFFISCIEKLLEIKSEYDKKKSADLLSELLQEENSNDSNANKNSYPDSSDIIPEVENCNLIANENSSYPECIKVVQELHERLLQEENSNDLNAEDNSIYNQIYIDISSEVENCNLIANENSSYPECIKVVQEEENSNDLNAEDNSIYNQIYIDISSEEENSNGLNAKDNSICNQIYSDISSEEENSNGLNAKDNSICNQIYSDISSEEENSNDLNTKKKSLYIPECSDISSEEENSNDLNTKKKSLYIPECSDISSEEENSNDLNTKNKSLYIPICSDIFPEEESCNDSNANTNSYPDSSDIFPEVENYNASKSNENSSYPEFIDVIREMFNVAMKKAYESALDVCKDHIEGGEVANTDLNIFLEEIISSCDDYFLFFLKSIMTDSLACDSLFKAVVKHLKRNMSLFNRFHPFLSLIVFSNYPRSNCLMLCKFLKLCKVIFSVTLDCSYSLPYLENLKNFLMFTMVEVYHNNDVNRITYMLRRKAAKFYCKIISKYFPKEKQNVISYLKKILLNKRSKFCALFGALCAIRAMGPLVEIDVIPEIFPSIVMRLRSVKRFNKKRFKIFPVKECKIVNSFELFSPTPSELSSEVKVIHSETKVIHFTLSESITERKTPPYSQLIPEIQSAPNFENMPKIGCRPSTSKEANTLDSIEDMEIDCIPSTSKEADTFGSIEDIMEIYCRPSTSKEANTLNLIENMEIDCIPSTSKEANTLNSIENMEIDCIPSTSKEADTFGSIVDIRGIYCQPSTSKQADTLGSRRGKHRRRRRTFHSEPGVQELTLYKQIPQSCNATQDKSEISKKRFDTIIPSENKFASLIKQELLNACAALTHKYVKNLVSVKERRALPFTCNSVSSDAVKMFLDYFGQELRDLIPSKYAFKTFPQHSDVFIKKMMIDLKCRENLRFLIY
ncbi:dentin sialophosphoprotein isoform X4 [Parasteatoda tepidariorum]|uniref:dentin sialophosphoprotein isoform X4 n=1 Tax=Parasteatoda tepidariorum TaxID=114398 RepID=UPI0039BC4CE6